VPAWRYPVDAATPDFASLVVPTVESVRLTALLDLVHSVGGASLLVGAPGTAKTTVVSSFLRALPADESVVKTLTWSSLTTPGVFQAAVEASIIKRQGRTYGPPAGRTLTLAVDDAGAPALNEWGDCPTAEGLRQLLEGGTLYSLTKPVGDVRSVVDTR
jgi:dynein heavy chain, axonemal